MLRRLIESLTGPLPDSEFREILDLTQTDIMVNHLMPMPGKRLQFTALGYLLVTATMTHQVLQKTKNAA